MKVIILRGLPGAGKSTWIKNNAPEATVCSADHFLINDDGQYEWSPKRVGRAHVLCQGKFMSCLQLAKPLVVVDNCNVTNRDLKFYVLEAEKYGYQIEIRTIHADPAVAAARQTHGVPVDRYPLLAQRLAMPLNPDFQKYVVPTNPEEKS